MKFSAKFVSIGFIGALLLSLHVSAREVYNFNPDWKFIKEDVAAGEKPALDDAHWNDVSLPHTFNDGDTFDNFCRGGHKGESEQFRGTVWYRKHFSIPKESKGSRVYIEFEGVRQVADVYLNGKKLGKDSTGFIPFGFDLTDGIKFGEDNILAVKVNNDRENNRHKSPTPWNHENWHPTFGGIYRNVYLTVTKPVHVTLPLYSNIEGQGAYVYSITNSADQILAGVDVEVANFLKTDVDAVLHVQVKDETGTAVFAVASKPTTLKAGSKHMLKEKMAWDNPIRWEPACPHVYQVHLQVNVQDQIVDETVIPFGVRTFAFTADKGAFINEKPYKMHGWGHKPTQGWPGLGGAIQNWQRDLTLKMMQEAGGNFIRWGHCAGSPFEASLGDKYGFMTMMPGVDGESDCQGEPWKIRSRAFRDLIIRYRNHPSIMVWEGGNYHVSTAHSAELKAHINQWDPHGKRSFGFRMANGNNGQHVTVELSTQGERPFFEDLGCVESEYLREESPRRVWDNQSPPNFDYKGGENKGNTYDLTQEEYSLKAIEFWWDSFGRRLWHGGGANWVFSDGTHGSRMVVEVARTSGEVDAVRLPKESYYVHQAMWRPDAHVQIIGHWSYPEGTKKNIYVAANTEEVELFLNGKSLGKGKRSHNHQFTWNDVSFEAGELKAVGYINGQKVAEQIERTVGKPVALKLTPTTAPGGWRADGSDVVLVDVEVVDKDGNRCPTDQGPVKFELTGEAEWRGGYNSGKEGTTLKKVLDTECGVNRISLRSTRKAGEAVLTVTRDGLKPATLKLASVDYPTQGGISTVLPANYAFSSADAFAYAPYRTYDETEALRVGHDKNSVFKSVIYTGEGSAMTISDITDRTGAYSDYVVKRIVAMPDVLVGTEIIRLPSAAGKVWARDLLVVTAAEDIDLYVAHSKLLKKKPSWLKEFKRAEGTIQVHRTRGDFALYKRELQKGETFTFSGNLDQKEAVSQKGSVSNFMLFGKRK